ncbi:MAG TPA: hypothetical protein VM029_05925 [Opitutaceae bacterium]|nr:hypothetical protein [Opitutaceae bacterium]
MTASRPTFEGVVSLIPLAAFAALFGFAALAYAKVGHWPLYSRPDPSELRLPLLYAAALLSFPAVLFSGGIAFISLAVRPDRWRRSHLAILLVGAAAWSSSVPLLDGLMNWLLD